MICFVFEYGHGAQSRTCATTSTDNSIRLHDGSKMRTILFKICTVTNINIESLSIDVCTENIVCFIFEYGHGTQCRACTASMNYSIRMHESKMCALLFKYAQLRCPPLSCAKRRDLVREPHNAARNHCDATFWLDHNGDQAHSVQRQAVRMHSHRANDSRAVLIISYHSYYQKITLDEIRKN
jgi:hypothetical protein